MQEALNLNELQEYINKGSIDVAFDILVNKSIDLVKKIATMKGLSLEDLESIKDRETLFYTLKSYLKKIVHIFKQFQI